MSGIETKLPANGNSLSKGSDILILAEVTKILFVVPSKKRHEVGLGKGIVNVCLNSPSEEYFLTLQP